MAREVAWRGLVGGEVGGWVVWGGGVVGGRTIGGLHGREGGRGREGAIWIRNLTSNQSDLVWAGSSDKNGPDKHRRMRWHRDM